MEEKHRFEYRKTNRIQRMGNSSGIPIPPDVLEELGIEEGEDLHIYVNKKLSAIMLFRPKEFAHKNWKEASFELSVPEELTEEMMQK